MTILLFVALFLFNFHEIRCDVVATFYSPVTRLWELLVGAALACGVSDDARWIRAVKLTGGAGCISGLALIVVPALTLDKSRLFPGLWAALPTAGAALLIATGPGAWLNRAVLARRALV